MKVQFDKGRYGGNRTISDGYATVVIVDGVAEIDITDEAMVDLAVKLGGAYAMPKEAKKAKGTETALWKKVRSRFTAEEQEPIKVSDSIGLEKAKDRAQTKRGKK